ncbi:MFS transporter [Sphingomonas koreensis]|nr:MFS transporter [Sphingomonas koreensis]
MGRSAHPRHVSQGHPLGARRDADECPSASDGVRHQVTRPVTERRGSRIRLVMLALITVATVINFTDRTVLGIVAPLLSKELRLSPVQMGLVFSIFSWSYAAAQIPGGVFLDRFGSRLTYFLSLVFWSGFTFLQGFIGNLGMLLGLRLGLGVAEAPCFPTNSRVVRMWFPQRERARATAVYSIGEYVGLAVFSPLLFWVTAAYGWRALFWLVGAVGLVFGLIWWLVYRDPSASKHVTREELDHIVAGGGIETVAPTPFSWHTLGWLAARRQVIGAGLGQLGANTVLVFFLTWFPTYLTQARHMSWQSSGFLSVVPFLSASVGVLVGGYVSDAILARTGSLNKARKIPMIAGFAMIACISFANIAPTNGWVIAAMSLAFFGQGFAGLGWLVITDVAPRELIGLTTGIFNLWTNLAGIVTPLVIGFVISATGSFNDGLLFVSVMACVGAASYAFVIGDIAPPSAQSS